MMKCDSMIGKVVATAAATQPHTKLKITPEVEVPLQVQQVHMTGVAVGLMVSTHDCEDGSHGQDANAGRIASLHHAFLPKRRSL